MSKVFYRRCGYLLLVMVITLCASAALYEWGYKRPHLVDNYLKLTKKNVYIGENIHAVGKVLDQLHWVYINEPVWQKPSNRYLIANPGNKKYNVVIYLEFHNGGLTNVSAEIEDDV